MHVVAVRATARKAERFVFIIMVRCDAVIVFVDLTTVVSYTHLTLPTIYLVYFSVVGVSLV